MRKAAEEGTVVADKEQIAKLIEGVAVWNAWREANSNVRVELSKANLSGVVISGANLIKANVRGAILSDAWLVEANLSEADLWNANLSEAIVLDANLTGANRSRANLTGANLSSANLSKANLSEAWLVEASFNKANPTGANLRRAEVDSSTHLPQATVKDCKIDRYQLELLGDDYGELTKGDRMVMNCSNSDLI